MTATTASTSRGVTSRFDVLESLSAIDKWREEMHEKDDDRVISLETYQKECLSPRPPKATSGTISFIPSGIETTTISTTMNTTPMKKNFTRGPSNDLTNETIIQLMLDKSSAIASEIKTRDGFRRFFNGISKKRLEDILNKVFKENQNKVQKRMQLMEKFFEDTRTGTENSSEYSR
jgi:hypothetical protein